MRTAHCSVALAAASVAAVLAQAPPQTGAIAGHVVDPVTGRSIAGAKVRLDAEWQPNRREPASPRTTTSDSTGSFVFDDVEP
ncbi:MAG TPA: carboxypeptidase-like regulatory domain-containing protein, partial [Vicinamibacterales bacterium]|nr:carboxypeptidase-like regulatory domain-containing protein [Vicinamibacterales bacterium]